MFKRLAIVFLLTGLGHVISIFALKYASENLTSEQFGGIAEIDTHLQLILSLIALGLQAKAIRDIAISNNWKHEYSNVQSARITLSFIVILISLFAIKDKQYLIYLISPLLALNGDYALYAKGYPIIGSLSAFLRTAIPLIIVMITSVYQKENVILFYLLSLFIIYLITNLIISTYLKVKIFYIPKLSNLKLYLSSLPIGIITLGYYFLGIGILIFAEFFYDETEIAHAFIVLKLYVIYKGVLRIIQQSFINEMKINDNCLKIDKLSINFGIIFLSSILAFPNSFITVFLGVKLLNQQTAIYIIGASAMLFSTFTSMTTKSLLDKKEKKLITIMLISVTISICTLFILSFIRKDVNNISISILTGELTLATFLAKSFLKLNEVIKRLMYIFKLSSGLVGCILISYYFGDTITNLLITSGILCAIIFLFSINLFRLTNVPKL